jgi:hypothetical protein
MRMAVTRMSRDSKCCQCAGAYATLAEATVARPSKEIMSKIRCAAMVALVLAAVHAASAEDVWVGLRAGLNVPWLTGGGNEVSRDYQSILAASAGAMAEYALTDHVSLLVELNYTGQGGERKGMQPITRALPGMPPLPPGQYYYGNFKNRSVLHYLEVPLMAKYHWDVADQWRCFVEFGPYVGYLLKAEQETSGSSQLYGPDRNPVTPYAVPFDANTDVRGDLNKWNVGLTAGVGTAYLINPRNQIFLDLRAEYGLTSLQKDTDTNGRSNTGCAAVLLGYMFKFGG